MDTPQPREVFHLERFFARHEFTTPHMLSVSDCETRTVGELLALEPEARETLEAMTLGYTPSEGAAELRQAIAATYGGPSPHRMSLTPRWAGLAADDVLMHGAGVEVLLTVALAVLKPGDHAVVQAPCYQAARSAPEMAGASVSLWEARPEDGWRPDLDSLARLFRSETRLLVINTPHNPTGSVLGEADLKAVLAMAESRGIQVLVDEAYRGAEHRVDAPLTSALQYSDQVAVLGLLSKAYGLPGLRTAWVASRNRPLLEAVACMKDYTTICAPGPAEYLATLAARATPEILRETREILAANLSLLADFMQRHRGTFRFHPPEGGSICMPVLVGDAAVQGAEAFCARAREAAGVLLAPGPLFDGPAHGVRFGFGRRSFPQALAALEGWLQ